MAAFSKSMMRRRMAIMVRNCSSGVWARLCSARPLRKISISSRRFDSRSRLNVS